MECIQTLRGDFPISNTDIMTGWFIPYYRLPAEFGPARHF